jgi:NAD(P)-dependent dehydrogenase (short-subunit alcohol dehydrogenase family)
MGCSTTSPVLEGLAMSAPIGRTFLVTGAGFGLGRAVVRTAARAGHTVVGTVRREEDRAGFEADGPGRSFIRLLDVTDEQAVGHLVDEVERDIAPIDVLISNSAFGHEGLIEESSMADLRRQFDVNVFGAVAVVKAVLPYLRTRRRGHIIAVTSMGGLLTSPGLGFYRGSKYALHGIMETLGQEVAGLGIHVTAVEPGSFRVDWAGPPMVRAPRSIPDYDMLFEAAGVEAPSIGDPDQAGQAILEIALADQPASNVLLDNILLGTGN